VALQPCGWLALGTGLPLLSAEPLHFRNLDGDLTARREVRPDTGTLTTRVRLIDVSRSGGMSLVFFQVETLASGEPVVQLTTSFGFFPGEALAQQVGLPPAGEEGAWFGRPTEASLDLASLRVRASILPRERLALLDRITGFWPTAGRAGLGRLRAEKDVRASDWFFKAHFYQDPVTPGSLGLESFLQLLKFAAFERWGWQEGNTVALAMGRRHSWLYRGQILPSDSRVTVEAWITAVDDMERTLSGDGFLSVDGRLIYRMNDFTLRME